MLHLPWSPASRHYASCHLLPDQTREHGGTGAWVTRRGEPAQPPTGSSLAAAPRLLRQDMGRVPKDEIHCLQLAGNQRPVCCCFNWEEDLAQGPLISQSSTGGSFPLPWGSQHLGWGRARLSIGSFLAHIQKNYNISHCKQSSKDQGRI